MSATRRPRKPAASRKAAPPGDAVETVLAEMRAALIAHVGQPSAVQAALIERAAWSNLHLRMLDERAASGAPLAAPDRQAFIQLSNVLIAALDALGPPASGGKALDVESLSDEDLSRIIATERAARMSAKRVERIVVETTA